MSKHSIIPQKELEDLYLNKHLTLAEIAKVYGKSRQRIWQLIKLSGISTQTAERFKLHCPQCDREFETTRKRFRTTSLRYCSSECYQAHRLACSSYNPTRTGQRHSKAVIEAHLGRPLQGKETIHHLDGNCDNNNVDNLVLFASHAEHIRYHHQIRIRDKELGTSEQAQAIIANESRNDYMEEARKIMSKHIGRPITIEEIVHHIDGNCDNNNLDNLMLFPNHSAHLRFHHSLRIDKYNK